MPLETIQTGSVRRKVLFVFLTVVVALALSYIISRGAFREMMSRVDYITNPDPKLELVQRISKDMIQSNNLIANKNYSITSNRIMLALDSLASLYQDNQTQLLRIDSLKSLMQQRNTLFDDYMTLRDNIVRNPILETQLSSLGKLIDESASDSIIRSTERQQVETTVTEPSDTKESRSFFSRIFGLRRSNTSNDEAQRKVIKEQTNVQVDTISKGRADSTTVKLGEVVQQIQSDNTVQRSQLLTRETALANTENTLTRNIFIILQSVEQDVYHEITKVNQEARHVVSKSINRISLIFIIFILVLAIMIYFILADIKRNNQYRQELEEAKDTAEYHANAKQRFLSNMSHELRTPLQSIIGFSQQLKEQNIKEKEMADAIYHSTEHLLQIVNEILDYSRIDSGKLVLENRAFDFMEVIDTIVNIMRPVAQKKQLDLSHNIKLNEYTKLWGDPYRVRQILFNLLSNAIKFTESGTVSLEVTIQGPQNNTTIPGKQIPVETTIVVRDSGIGIPPQDLERIFVQFEQSNFSSNSIQYGSGLGLSIVKGICESMDGSIRVESEVNKGTVFYVHLPFWTAPTEIEDGESIDNTEQQVQEEFKGKVWLIDDDALILSLCEMILNKHQIPYKAFSTPKQLLEEQLDDQLSTILMDIRMPGLDGYQLNKELRKKFNKQGIPEDKIKLYAFTAQALPEEQESIRKQGFDDLLLKPFREEDLLKLLGITPGSNQRKTVVETNVGIEMEILEDSKIIELFVKDTIADIEELKAQKDDPEAQSFTFHRLAGRIGQMGDLKLSFDLKKLEIDTRAGELLKEEILHKYILSIQQFMEEVTSASPDK